MGIACLLFQPGAFARDLVPVVFTEPGKQGLLTRLDFGRALVVQLHGLLVALVDREERLVVRFSHGAKLFIALFLVLYQPFIAHGVLVAQDEVVLDAVLALRVLDSALGVFLLELCVCHVFLDGLKCGHFLLHVVVARARFLEKLLSALRAI